MQPVGGDQESGAFAVTIRWSAWSVTSRTGRWSVVIPASAARSHSAACRGSPHTKAVAVTEGRLGGPIAVEISDAGERVAVEPHTQVAQGCDCCGHQPFAAGLVDHSGARLSDAHVEALACCV